MKLSNQMNIKFSDNVWQHQNAIAHGDSSKQRYRQKENVLSHQTYGLLQAKYTKKPLREGASAQTFEGSLVNKVFRPKPTKLSKKLVSHALNILEQVNPAQKKQYQSILSDFSTELSDPKFRAKLNISEELLIDADNVAGTSQKNMAHKFFVSFFEPVTSPAKNLFIKVFAKENSSSDISKKALQLKRQNELQKNYASVEGLVNFITKAEEDYRRKYKLPHYEKGMDLIIPDEVLAASIRKNHFKSFDPKKGQYSTTTLSIGNRIVSGAIAASFLSVDAFNTTMALTNDKKTAATEQKSRFTQEVGRIATTAFLMHVVQSVFKEQINRSLYNALFTSCATIAASEIVGRKLVGKPILPSNKETLDKMEQERNEKKKNSNITKFLGGVTGKINKSNAVKVADKPAEPVVTQTKETFNNNKQVSFGARLASTGTKMFKTKEVLSMLDLLRNPELNPKGAEYFSDVILRGLNKGKNAQESAKDLLSAVQGKETISLGDTSTMWDKVSYSFFAPVHWVADPFIKISKYIKNKKTTKDFVKMINDMKLNDEFNDFKSSRLSALSGKSKLNQQDLTQKLAEEFVDAKTGRLKEELKGVQNTLIWLRKEIINAAPADKKNMPLEDIVQSIMADPKKLEHLQKELNKAGMKADILNQPQYNSATYATMNVNLGKFITSMFLIIDAYNLTMQHSNDDKKKSVGSMKDRGVQEASRIATSAYILKFARTFFEKFHNTYLLGALLITGAECMSVETVSRKLVGRPTTPKTQQELTELEEKNNKSKNPVMKFLIYVLGKKGKNPSAVPAKATVNMPSSQEAVSYTAQAKPISSNEYVNRFLAQNKSNV